MKKTIILCLSILTISISCKKKRQERVIIEKVKLKKSENFENYLKKYKTIETFKNNDCEFVLAGRKTDERRLLFYTKGLKPEFKEVLRFKGNVLNIFTGDINNDNIQELYITLSPLKGDDYATVKDVGIFGYTLKDNKVARIYAENQETNADQDYTDKVTLKNNVLTRTYIINQKESSFNYNLDFTGDNYLLTPQ